LNKMAEYVKLTAPEKEFGEKNLLQSQLELLSIIKHLKEYLALRKDELAFKISLKNRIDKAFQEIDIFGKFLPKPKLVKEVEADSEENISMPHIKVEKDRITLEQEIDMIKQKLSHLQHSD